MPPPEHAAREHPLVLVVDPQEWSARSLESILMPHGYDVRRAASGGQGLELAGTEEPDAVIVDYQLPDMTAEQFCRVLCADPEVGPTLPIIVTLDVPTGRQERLDVQRAGAWECCSKPLDAEVLERKLAVFTRAKRHADALRRTSVVDLATGLYNMRGMERRSHEIAAESSRRHAPVSCVALSLARDGRRRDSGAHGELSAASARLAAALRACSRVSDAVARLGGDDFAIVAPATSLPGAERLIERLQATLDAAAPGTGMGAGGAEHPQLRAAYAMVEEDDGHPADPMALVTRAVQALHEAHLPAREPGEATLRRYGNGGPERHR